MIAVKFNFLIDRERRKLKKKFPPWHGINLGSFASRAISLSLSHGDIGR